ncbi:WD repeat-containing protein 76-like [Amphiura filiformis]|uniref:WD repeat-containing protein 76-like n=1 Tax=Amphiura filiformis TaxID=82378 RepID=UPI003B20F777
MIGASRSSGAIPTHSFYLTSKIMPKRKVDDVKPNDEELVDKLTDVDDKLNKNMPSPKRRRVSRRLQNAKSEEEEKPEIKKEPEPQQPTTDEESDSDNSMDDDGISTYEKMRLKNIEDNAKFFASLEIFKAKEDLSIASGTAVKKTPSRRGLKREPTHKEVLPRRPRSLRIQRIDPGGSPLPPLPEVVQPERKYRQPSEAIEMVSMNVPEESREKYSTAFVKTMRDLAKSPKPSVPKSSDLQTFCKAFHKMRLAPERVAKVTKDRIFSVAIHPSKRKVLACAGDKWGKIGMWDVEAQGHSEDGVHLFEPHTRPVNVLQFAPDNLNKIYSASYDGTVRCGDFVTGVFDEVYATPDDDDIWITGFDFLTPDGSQLLVSQNNRLGFLAVVDTRKRSNPKQVFEVHDRNVKTVCVHPVKKHYFVTASSDRTVALWDMRNMKENGRSKPIVSLPHFKVVSSAYFSPITGSKILTTSGDDKIRIFTCTESGDVLKGAQILSTVKHNNFTGRWLTNFRATWHPAREDVFVSGSMARPRKIEIFDDHGRIVHNFLDEESLGSVCSINAFHPTRDILVGGNSSGRLHVFM